MTRSFERLKVLEAMKYQASRLAFNLGARVSRDSRYGRQLGTKRRPGSRGSPRRPPSATERLVGPEATAYNSYNIFVQQQGEP
jgi:hypothetical protein